MGCKWEMQPLGELLSYIGKGIAPRYVEDDVLATMVLGQKCVRHQRVNYGEARFHNEQSKPVKSEKVVRSGDILINATGVGSAGRVAQVIATPKRRCITDSHVITLRARGIDSLYLGYYLKTKQAIIEQLAEGSTGQTEMNRSRLQNEIIVSFPSALEDQRRIAGFGLAIDRKLEVNQRTNDYLAA